MSLKHLVLLPGLDGTGELFGDFIAALPQSLIAIPVAYPADRVLSYIKLLEFVGAAIPQSDPFVLLAESFSTPLAISTPLRDPRIWQRWFYVLVSQAILLRIGRA